MPLLLLPTLIMEAIFLSKILVRIYQTTRRHIPEDHNLDIQHRKNVRSIKPGFPRVAVP
jgi:hypothetical protein